MHTPLLHKVTFNQATTAPVWHHAYTRCTTLTMIDKSIDQRLYVAKSHSHTTSIMHELTVESTLCFHCKIGIPDQSIVIFMQRVWKEHSHRNETLKLEVMECNDECTYKYNTHHPLVTKIVSPEEWPSVPSWQLQSFTWQGSKMWKQSGKSKT